MGEPGRYSTILSDPAVVSMRPGRLDIFVQGTDNAVWHKAFENGWWPSRKGYQVLEGRTVDGPSAVSWGDKRLDVFVGQADVADLMVSQESLVAGVWIGWHALGGRVLGYVVPHPTAFNQIFARGPLGQLLRRS